MTEKKSQGFTYDRGRLIGPGGPDRLLEDLKAKQDADRNLWDSGPAIPPDKRGQKGGLYPWEDEKTKE